MRAELHRSPHAATPFTATLSRELESSIRPVEAVADVKMIGFKSEVDSYS